MAAREIIITSSQKLPAVSVSGVFWLVTPANMVSVDSTRKSMLPSSTAAPWGVTAAELTAIQNGTVYEQSFLTEQPAGTTLANLESILQTLYANAQTALNASAPANKFVGAFWDGATWTAAP